MKNMKKNDFGIIFALGIAGAKRFAPAIYLLLDQL